MDACLMIGRIGSDLLEIAKRDFYLGIARIKLRSEIYIGDPEKY